MTGLFIVDLGITLTLCIGDVRKPRLLVNVRGVMNYATTNAAIPMQMFK